MKKQASTVAGRFGRQCTLGHLRRFQYVRVILVGPAMRAERKVIDKIVDGLKFHS
jgi:hypothetical protein